MNVNYMCIYSLTLQKLKNGQQKKKKNKGKEKKMALSHPALRPENGKEVAKDINKSYKNFKKTRNKKWKSISEESTKKHVDSQASKKQSIFNHHKKAKSNKRYFEVADNSNNNNNNDYKAGNDQNKHNAGNDQNKRSGFSSTFRSSSFSADRMNRNTGNTSAGCMQHSLSSFSSSSSAVDSLSSSSQNSFRFSESKGKNDKNVSTSFFNAFTSSLAPTQSKNSSFSFTSSNSFLPAQKISIEAASRRKLTKWLNTWEGKKWYEILDDVEKKVLNLNIQKEKEKYGKTDEVCTKEEEETLKNKNDVSNKYSNKHSQINNNNNNNDCHNYIKTAEGLYNIGRRLLETFAEIFQEHVSKDSHEKWLRQIAAEEGGMAAKFLKKKEKNNNSYQKNYNKKNNNNTSNGDAKNIGGKGGTLADRTAALSLLLQRNGVFNYTCLKKLLRMCGKKGRRESILSAERLRQIYIDDLLPNRKLRFMQQKDKTLLDIAIHAINVHTPFSSSSSSTSFHNNKNRKNDKHVLANISNKSNNNNDGSSDKNNVKVINIEKIDEHVLQMIILYSFEDLLKASYASYIQLLAELLQDSVLYVKQQALQNVYELLLNKPEQETALLSCLIEKLGDKTNKIASSCSLLMAKIILAHPKMKYIITKYVAQFVLKQLYECKNKNSVHTPTFATASKTHKKYKQRKKRFVDRYDGKYKYIFENLLKNLPPLYRGLLFLSELHFARKESNFACEVMRFYLHIFNVLCEDPSSSSSSSSSSFNEGKKKKKKNFFSLFCQHAETNRIVHVILKGMHRALPYINEKQFDDLCLDENMKVLYKVVHILPTFSTRITLLSLLYSFLKASNMVTDRYYRLLYEQLVYIDTYTSSKRTSLLTLVSKVLSEDRSVPRVTSFFKRLVQMTSYVENVGYSIVILKVLEVFCRHRKCLLLLLNTPEFQLQDNEEVFKDAELSDDESSSFAEKCNEEEKDDVYEKQEKNETGGDASKFCKYDFMKREPKYAKADESHLWEVVVNAASYHPSIAAHAKALCTYAREQKHKNDSTGNEYDGDDDSIKEYMPNEKEIKEIMHSSSSSFFLEKLSLNSKKDRQTDECGILYNSSSENIKNKNNKRNILKQQLTSASQTHVAPCDEWLSLYFNDPFVKETLRRKKLLRGKKGEEDDVDCNEKEKEKEKSSSAHKMFDEESDEEDTQIDKFLEQSMKGQIPDFSDDDEDGEDIGENDDGEEGEDDEGTEEEQEYEEEEEGKEEDEVGEDEYHGINGLNEDEEDEEEEDEENSRIDENEFSFDSEHSDDEDHSLYNNTTNKKQKHFMQNKYKNKKTKRKLEEMTFGQNVIKNKKFKKKLR